MSTEMVYTETTTKELKFYIINEQEKHVTRVRDQKQIELLSYCIYGAQLRVQEMDDMLNRLINSGYLYFDSVDEFVKWQIKDLEEL